MNEELRELQAWYALQCDGDWEHKFGIRIATLDNPGWAVEIDLHETELESRGFAAIDQRASDAHWFRCRIVDSRFEGAGDPGKPERILHVFLDWARST